MRSRIPEDPCSIEEVRRSETGWCGFDEVAKLTTKLYQFVCKMVAISAMMSNFSHKQDKYM